MLGNWCFNIMKSILIVGASSGIGKELGRQLSAHGLDVYGTYNDTKVPPEDGVRSLFPLDVMSPSFNFGFLPDSLDGLIYCPGSLILKPFTRISPSEFLKDYELQVVGAVKVIQGCLPKLKKSNDASIVLFSTIAVQVGFNFHSLVSSSKGAVEGLTKALAAEFAPKIRVNCIAPSITDTPLATHLLSTPEKKDANAQRHPLKKIGMPEDIANLIRFLISSESNWMTGQVFHIDGGLSSLKV